MAHRLRVVPRDVQRHPPVVELEMFDFGFEPLGSEDVNVAEREVVRKRDATEHDPREIVLLQRSVASAKKDFGPHVYDAMVSGNQSEIDRLFAEVKTKVQGLEAQIEAKRQAVADLKVPASARGSGGDDDVTPPPPGPAPEAADVPAGWKKTTTAEGREYYYHEATGETSWTVPTAKE